MKTFAACTLALVASDFASAFTGPLAVRSATSVGRASSSSVCMSVGDEVGSVFSSQFTDIRRGGRSLGVSTTACGCSIGVLRWDRGRVGVTTAVV